MYLHLQSGKARNGCTKEKAVKVGAANKDQP